MNRFRLFFQSFLVAGLLVGSASGMRHFPKDDPSQKSCSHKKPCLSFILRSTIPNAVAFIAKNQGYDNLANTAIKSSFYATHNCLGKTALFAATDGGIRYLLKTENGKLVVDTLDCMSGSEWTSPETNAMAKEASIGLASYVIATYGQSALTMIYQWAFPYTSGTKKF